MLEVRDLKISYGGIDAVHGVSLEVQAGEIVSIIGANGAGKSSILNAISGITNAKSGQIIFHGEQIQGLASHEVIARKIVQVPEGRLTFGSLSVEENLHIANYQQSRFVLRQGLYAELNKIFPTLMSKLNQPAASLSGGEAQMLAIARGIVSKPRLLLLDEPSLGLSPKMAKSVFRLIVQLRNDGLTILVVEQNVVQTLKFVDRAYVLESGHITQQGTVKELLSDNHLVSNYLGVEVK